MKKYKSEIQNIGKSIFSNKAVIIILSLFVFLYFKGFIINFINDFLTIEENTLGAFFDVLIILTSVLTTFFLIFKIIFHTYKPSFTQQFTLGLALFFYVFFQSIKDELPWKFLPDSIFNLEYVTYFFIPLITATIFFVVITAFVKIENIFPSSRFSNKIIENVYLSDDPILDEKDDILSYQPKISSLAKILLNESFNKSISIGIVGPWGNGKSSVIFMTQKQIIENDRDDLIVIHFLPFLNHNEKDIINEFFTILSNELSQFSGKLSSQILDYAKRLTDVYKGSNVFNLFDKHVTNYNSSSAKELYDSINKLLIEIDKKIIVFVDDLDRLSGKEIIQVLKLIRNTADFRNTIFVVALDKDYVINRLKAENNISSSRFIDKFFQLEIYLPEINKPILRAYVFNSLKKSVLNNSFDFEIKLSKGLNHEDNLFEDFIKNIRDAKRFVNQIIFDYSFLRDEINFKDFMNFTYFKLKFPKFMELLNHNRLDFLELENGEYRLKEKPPNGEEANIEETFNYHGLVMLGSTRYNDYSYLNKYAVSDLLKTEQDCLKKMLNIDCEDTLQLSKTLAFLFGSQNKVESFNSIKKENNFSMLMQQRVFENVLTESEFQHLIKEAEIGAISNILESLFSQNKLDQLLDRLNYYSSDEKNLLSNIILVLFRLYEKRNDYRINEQQLLNKMAIFVEKLIMNGREISEEHVNWVKADLFESNLLGYENKLSILSELWESRDENKLWHMGEEYVSDKALLLFKEYLNNYNGNLWNVNDYTFYKHYHAIKNINNLKEELNSVVKEFWKNNDIELLCTQSTDFPPFSYTSYRISAAVSEIYGSISKFHEFISGHSENPSDAVKEFLELYKLHKITGYSLPILYNFEHSKLMLDKIIHYVKFNGRPDYDEFDNHIQLIFETNSELLISEIVALRMAKNEDQSIIRKYPNLDISYQKLDLLQFSIFTFNKKHYLFLSYDKKHRYNNGIEILKAFGIIAQVLYKPESNNFSPYRTKLTQKVKIEVVEDIYLQVISIQLANTIKPNAQ